MSFPKRDSIKKKTFLFEYLITPTIGLSTIKNLKEMMVKLNKD